jgi:hypothetical protein
MIIHPILRCTFHSLKFIFFACLINVSTFSQAQILKDWHGNWEGIMYIYGKGALRDSVPVVLTIATINDSTLVWRTEYKSVSQPMVKDYKMKLIDLAKGIYGTEEGKGLVLTNYLVEKSLYSVFEMQGILLTATYRLEGDQIVFEVTSGKKEVNEMEGVANYSVSSLQKVQLKRQSGVGSNGLMAGEPLYFLDGRQITKTEMDKIDPNTMESVNVLKGEHAVKAFGQAANNGVILIKLKIAKL